MIFEMNVVYVKAAKTKGYLRLRVNDGEEDIDLIVSEREYADCGSPIASDNLTRDAFSVLKEADMRHKARHKALRVLEYGDNSERMLVIKLLRSGISRRIAEETAREMVMRGFVDDKRQLARLIASEVKCLHGPIKFIPKLVSKGYSRSDIEIVIDELTESGEIDLDAARALLIERAGDISYEERAKLLYKNGFTTG
jgi:SOS response regulatory protein OraA/RecX